MINNEQWQQGILSIDSSIEDAINNLNHSALKIILIVNESGELDGTIADGDNILTNGGRVLAATSFGKNFNEAVEKSFKTLEKIHFKGMYYRKDIGFDL